MLEESKLLDRMEALSQMVGNGKTYHLYGDAAYPIGPYMMLGYKCTRGAEEQLLTVWMKSFRVSVEQAFAHVLCDWHFLVEETNLKLWRQPVALMYVVADLLTNIKTCLMAEEHDAFGNQISMRFRKSPPSLHAYLHGL